jgi:hypothetical protein
VADDTRDGTPKLPKKQPEFCRLMTGRHSECAQNGLLSKGSVTEMLYERIHCVLGEGPHLKEDRQDADTSV